MTSPSSAVQAASKAFLAKFWQENWSTTTRLFWPIIVQSAGLDNNTSNALASDSTDSGSNTNPFWRIQRSICDHCPACLLVNRSGKAGRPGLNKSSAQPAVSLTTTGNPQAMASLTTSPHSSQCEVLYLWWRSGREQSAKPGAGAGDCRQGAFPRVGAGYEPLLSRVGRPVVQHGF